ncbi:glutamate 5-kinase [Candidatus Margulisiibacteriota bacterium]
MFNTIVIKVGSSSLTDPQGKLDHQNLERIVSEIASLIKEKKRVVLVTSGAIVCGAETLKLGKPKSIPEKQAAAAVGQSRLMRQYDKAFEKSGIITAQVLLTRDAIINKERHLNAKHTFDTLLKEKAVPIVNENDAVAVEEIKIGDNDNLAALTASLIKADLLILLTDVDGFYLKDEQGKSYLVPEINKIDQKVEKAAGSPTTQHGTGGMKTKIEAAKVCKKAGITMAIINGRKDGEMERLIAGKQAGTIFFPKA